MPDTVSSSLPSSAPLTVLFTGGRAPVTLELARLFARAGHRVLVADSLRHQLCTCSRAVSQNFVVPAPRSQPAAYIAALKNIIQSQQVDWLIPTCEEIFYIAAGLAQLTPYCRVLTAPLEKLEPLHNKWTFIQKVRAMGLAAPETWLIRSRADLQAVLSGDPPSEGLRHRPDKIVLKPVYSRFASQVQIVSKPADPESVNIDLRPDKPWVAQTFIAGTHYCLYGIAHQGQLTAFAAYPTVFTAGAGSCICFESAHHPGLLSWMKTFVAAEQFTGQIAFDLIEAPDKTLYPLECNPRAISAIHLFSSGDSPEARRGQRLVQAFLSASAADEATGQSTGQTKLAEPQSDALAMITLAMVLYGLPSAVLTRRLSVWVNIFLRAKDVIFQWRDPLPALHLSVTLLQFVVMSIRARQSLQRVSTQDIEWDGEPIDVSP